jgi:hypothetical protein
MIRLGPDAKSALPLVMELLKSENRADQLAARAVLDVIEDLPPSIAPELKAIKSASKANPDVMMSVDAALRKIENQPKPPG